MKFKFGKEGEPLVLDEDTKAQLVKAYQQIIAQPQAEGKHPMAQTDLLEELAEIDPKTLQSFGIFLGKAAEDSFERSEGKSAEEMTAEDQGYHLATLLITGIDFGLQYALNNGWVPPAKQ